MKEALEELAARVEALQGPNRAADWQVHLRDGLDGVGMYGDHPHYTASIDAAMSLVPEGWAIKIEIYGDVSCVSLVDDRVHPERLPDVGGEAATLAAIKGNGDGD